MKIEYNELNERIMINEICDQQIKKIEPFDGGL